MRALGKRLGPGSLGFPGNFRQQDLGSLSLVEAENFISLITAGLWFQFPFASVGRDVTVLTRAEVLQTTPVIKRLSGQGCVSSCCDVPRSPFPKLSVVRKAGK